MIYYKINKKIIAYENELDPTLYNYVKLTDEEVEAFLNPPAPIIYVPNIEDVRANAIETVKNHAKEQLEPTDYKVTRHNEQLSLNVTTTLTVAEFALLLAQRQSIRDKSNVKEMPIINATTIEEINEIITE